MSHAVMMAGCELTRAEPLASKSALSFQQSGQSARDIRVADHVIAAAIEAALQSQR